MRFDAVGLIAGPDGLHWEPGRIQYQRSRDTMRKDTMEAAHPHKRDAEPIPAENADATEQAAEDTPALTRKQRLKRIRKVVADNAELLNRLGR